MRTFTTVMTMALTMGAFAAVPHGINVANIDTSVSPGTDFYNYACGGWIKANPLKAEYSRFGTFDQLGELNRKQVYDLVTGLDPKKAVKGTNEQKIADLFAMGMDSVRLNREGAQAIQADLRCINKAKRSDIAAILGGLPGASGFFGTGTGADMINSNINVMYWQQGGLGLGNRDYYISKDPNEQAVLDAYKKYLNTIATLAGYNEKDAQRLVNNTIAIETSLAEAATTNEGLRDPGANYNPMSMVEVKAKYPHIDFDAYFKAQGLNSVDSIVVGQLGSIAAVDSILAKASIQSLRDYVAAGYISSASSFLSDDFINAGFELQKAVSGVQQIQPRWKRALSVPNGMLGEALGELYVAKYFPASSKEKMLALVNNLKAALGQHISNLTWMSDATKAKALEKLNAFTVKIGYPDKWRDYSALTIDPMLTYWENIKQAMLFVTALDVADYGKPVDKARWYMTPQTVNAYYSPSSNEICFPAGILQAPFFDPEADDAINYGAIGVVIGHEMTHGFDDQGRQFDKDGNFKEWWAPEDAEAFKVLADKLVAQFDSIVVLGDTHANGRLTLGENIADQGGLRVAYTAYHNSLGDNGTDIDGFTPDQRFYLSYANVWAANIRDAEILKRTKSDPHSLGRWRVNATLRNIEPFFTAFGIKEGDPMFRVPSDRVIIW